MMDSPQNREKLAAIIEYDFPPTLTDRLLFHHFGWNACWISAVYVVLSPVVTSARGPSTLSVELTFWLFSGLAASIFWPTSGNVRPAADISTELSTGPTA